jgi:hypothetical protein
MEVESDGVGAEFRSKGGVGWVGNATYFDA